MKIKANSAVSNSSAVSEDCLDKNAYQEALAKLEFESEVKPVPVKKNCFITGIEALKIQLEKLRLRSFYGKISTFKNFEAWFEGDDLVVAELKKSQKDEYDKWLYSQHRYHDNGFAWLQKMAIAAGGNGYILPNHLEGGYSNPHFIKAASFFMEPDNCTTDEQWEKLDQIGRIEIGIVPSFVVTSGNRSLHTYYSIVEDLKDPNHWSYIQKLLAIIFASDLSIVKPCQVMRLAGLQRNIKGKITQQAILFQSDNSYSVAEFQNKLEKYLGLSPNGLTEWHWDQCRKAIKNGATLDERKAILRQEPPKQQPKTPKEITEIKQRLETEYKEGVYPLVNFLSSSNREALNGVPYGTIHNSMRDLAIELVAASNLLSELGINYEGDAREIFDEACDRCEKLLDATERDDLWDNAETGNFEYLGGVERIEENCRWYDHKAGKKANPASNNGNARKMPEFAEQQLKMLSELKDTPLTNVEYVHIYEQWLGECLPNLIEKGAINLVISYPGSQKTEGMASLIKEAGCVKGIFYLDALGIDACTRLGLKWHNNPGKSDKIGVSVPSAFKYPCNDLRRADALCFNDELDQSIDQRFSSLCNKNGKRPLILESFKNDMICALKEGGTVVGASADIWGIHVKYLHDIMHDLRDIMHDQFKIRVIINDYVPERPTVKMLKGKSEILVQELIEELERVKWDEDGNPKWGIFVANTFKSDGKAISKVVERLFVEGKLTGDELRDKILAVHPEWANHIECINSDNSKQPEVLEYLNNINVRSKRTLLLIASPSLASGFSIHNGHFRSIFCFNHGNLTAKMVGQFIARVRGCQDIRIWSADFFAGKEANGSFNPNDILAWWIKNYDINQVHLRHYGVHYLALTDEHKYDAHFVLKCQLDAYSNICYQYPKQALKLHLERSGYKVEQYEHDELKVKAGYTKESLKIHKACDKVTYALQVAAKPVLTPEQFSMLSEDKSLEQKQLEEKYWLNKKYGDELAQIVEANNPIPTFDKEEKEVNKLTGYAALYFLDKQGLYKKLKMLYLVLHPEGCKLAARIDKKKEEVGIWQEQYGTGKRLLTDTSQLTAKVGLCKKLKINFKPGEVLSLDERKQITDKLRAEATKLNNWLGFKIPEDMEDGQLFSDFVSKILGLEPKSVQKKVNGERVRHSKITKESWNYFELFRKYQDSLQDQQEF
jgi:hypothetical protein